jgi:Domain of unknown function (DUF4424)
MSGPQRCSAFMMRVRKHAIAVASVAVTSIGALASDQSIELATGGLNFVRHASLEIVLQDILNYEFLAAVERVRRAANSKSTAPFSEHRIEYLLKIAANTATAVAQFRFTIDKGGPENLVSFCGAESFKADETTVEVKKTDYIPDGSVPVLILQKLPP